LKAKKIILLVRDGPKVAAFYRAVLGLKIKGDPADKDWIDLDAGAVVIGLHGGGQAVSS
jgi:hypothetical protein